jgi:hypothetical protein
LDVSINDCNASHGKELINLFLFYDVCTLMNVLCLPAQPILWRCVARQAKGGVHQAAWGSIMFRQSFPKTGSPDFAPLH